MANLCSMALGGKGLPQQHTHSYPVEKTNYKDMGTNAARPFRMYEDHHATRPHTDEIHDDAGHTKRAYTVSSKRGYARKK